MVEIRALSELNWQLIGLICGLLALFGLGFNHAYTRADATGSTQGYTWLWVVVGTGVTLLGAGIVFGLATALVTFAMFAASGAPMAWGEISRYNAARRAVIEAAKAERDA